MNTVLLNLLRFPPVEGSREAHEAWKQNVRLLMIDADDHSSMYDSLWKLYDDLLKPGYVTRTCADASRACAEVLTKAQG